MSKVEKPITFCMDLLPKVFDGTKTMTRRVSKITYANIEGESEPVACVRDWDGGPSRIDMMRGGTECAPYLVGDLLWVREPLIYSISTGLACYRLDNVAVHPALKWCWKNNVLPGRFMPKDVARHWLKVTEVRAERLQDISAEDAVAEGVNPYNPDGLPVPISDDTVELILFRHLWDDLNAKRGHPWENNDYVWVYTFERTEAPK